MKPADSRSVDCERLALSAQGAAAIAALRQRLAERPKDETLSVHERRQALAALSESRSATVSSKTGTIEGVPIEYYLGAEAPPGPSILYAHGGAYVIGSVATHRSLASAIACAADTPLVSIDYRLAPEHPYPAARDDIVEVYRELAGRDGSRIALVGDSAGGGLVLQAALAIRDADLPRPAAIAMISPWVDLTCKGGSYQRNRDLDVMLTPEGLALDAARYLSDLDPSDPGASPIFGDLAGLPATLIQVGGDEILLDDAQRLADLLARHDVPVSLQIWTGMTHAWQAFPNELPEASAAIGRLGAFVRAALATA